MTHQPSPGTETPLESPSPSTPFAHRVRLAVRTLQVRLRFILVLAAAFLVVGQWDSLRNYWDLWTRALVKGEAASRAVPPNSEYFCPMDPGIVSITPGKCDICHMALVRRKIGDTAPLPSGVVARMQFSPYRVQLAGIQTAPADYQPTARSATLDGLVRDDGLIACRLADHDRAVVVAGLPVEVVRDDDPRQAQVAGKVSRIDVDPKFSHATALIRLDGSGPPPPAGTRVIASVRRPVAELEPFRSLPSDPPPLAKGDLLAVYVCPQHPEVLATDRGVCPVDRDNKLQRLALKGNQRVGWWCPMHPKLTADHAGASCDACGGMKLIPRVVTYRPRGEVLTVPESAVVDTGTRTVVFVERSVGMFDGVEVELGPRCGDVYPVVRGLEPGQRVAVSGAFLLDAETRLNPSVAAGYFGAARSTRTEPAAQPGTAETGVCPVTGKPLGSMGPPVIVTVNGQTVSLCCEACETPLRKAPEKYLSKPKTR